MLAIVRVERMKRGTRIEFLAGHRARADYARKHATVRSLSAALTCAPAEIVDAVARLSGAVSESRRALAVYRERDLDEEAVRLRATASMHGKLRVGALASLGGGKGGGGRILMGAAGPADVATLDAVLGSAAGSVRE